MAQDAIEIETNDCDVCGHEVPAHAGAYGIAGSFRCITCASGDRERYLDGQTKQESQGFYE